MYIAFPCNIVYMHVHVHATVKPVYSGHLGTQQSCPYYRGVLISEVHFIRIYIVVGPLLTVLIIEVSLFQTVHNSRFDCILGELYYVYQV